MKILVIRGKNLASLSGEFEIDFEQAPLSENGLFVITGPTGAGKTTLLDALCLALFDSIPRLPTGHGIAVGRSDEPENLHIKSNDVRSILRRGTAEGYAEVEFVGVDSRCYKSTWSIRRARGKVAGRLISQTLKLTDLATKKEIGRTKTEVLHAIKNRLGLNFEQFQRSVLLAQGNFAAFLKANADERSGLLERMTGTEIYSNLSQAAYSRATEEARKLQEIFASQQLVAPLQKESREMLVNAIENKTTELKQTQEGLKELNQYKQWQQVEQELSGQYQLEVDKLTKAKAAVENSEPLREKIRLVQKIIPLQTRFNELNTLQNRMQENKRNHQAIIVEIQRFEKELDALNKSKEKAEYDKHESIRNYEISKPDIDKAREIDASLRLKIDSESLAKSAVDKKQNDLQTAKDTQSEIENQIKKMLVEVKELEKWFDKNANYQELHQQWSRWESEIKRLSDLHIAYLEKQTKKSDTAKQLEKGRVSVAQIKSTIENQKSRVQKLREERDVVRKNLTLFSSFDEYQSRGSLQDKLDLLRSADSLWKEHKELQAEIEKYQSELMCEAQRSVDFSDIIQEKEKQESTQNAVLKEVRQSLRLAELTMEDVVASLRKELLDDKPCPVCGAEQHPWRSKGVSAMSDHLRQMQQRYDKLQSEYSDLQEELKQLNIDCSAVGEKIEILRKEKEKSVIKMSGLQLQWNEVQLVEKPEIDSKSGVLELLQDAERKMQEVKQRELEEINLRHQLEGLSRQLEQEGEELDEFIANGESLKTDIALGQQKLTQLEIEIEEHENLIGNAKQLLNQPMNGFSQWESEIERNGTSFLKTLTLEVMRYGKKLEQLSSVSVMQEELEVQKIASENHLQHCLTQLGEVENNWRIQANELAAMRRQREKLLNGESVNDIEQRLISHQKKTTSQLDSIITNISEIKQKKSKQNGRLSELVFGLEQDGASYQHSLESLTADLALAGINLGILKEFQQYDHQWLELKQQTLFDLQEEFSRAEALTEEQKKRWQAHQNKKPDKQFADISEKQAEFNRLIADIESRLFDLRSELKSDDKKAAQFAGFKEAYCRQEKIWEKWQSLNELIGSADGRKFRRFAQSLTLDVLLGFANQHLKDLSDRYRLQRVPHSDLELQIIDRHMGGEVRSVHSLSGGESFLASLALALGLASLSSTTTKVESLFIDEGFGSLDQETLDVAIASLDTLQSVGRKVGVISHIPALVERIGVQIQVQPHGRGGSVVLPPGSL